MTSQSHHTTRHIFSFSCLEMKKTTIIILGAAVVMVAASLIIALPYLLSGSVSAAVIRIPREARMENITDSLTKYFGKDYAERTTRVFRTLTDSPASRHGAYEIPEGESPLKAGRLLARGAQTPVTVTINGVREFLPFADRIAAKFDFSGDDLREALGNAALLKEYGLTTEQAPALFLNDTYYLYWSSTPEELIRKAGDNYMKFWTPERRAKADSLGLTPAEVMIIASITDEETNQTGEKGRVGRLYINRLHKGMKLQADPTVRFALHDFTIKRVTGRHLQEAPAPYNTYKVKGLPPGPIRTTSTATVDAILNSSPSDDIYMCAREDFSGFHNFASNYDDHLRNARLYQQALDGRGIK